MRGASAVSNSTTTALSARPCLQPRAAFGREVAAAAGRLLSPYLRLRAGDSLGDDAQDAEMPLDLRHERPLPLGT